jgi:hypothetical protein
MLNHIPALLRVVIDLIGDFELEDPAQKGLARIRHFNPGFFNADCILLTYLDATFATDAFVGLHDNRLAVAHRKYPGGAGL